jgi:hypothetical protein
LGVQQSSLQFTRRGGSAVAELRLVRPMATLLNRGLSVAVAVGYLTFAYLHGSGLDTAKVAAALLLPMACIWFPEALGDYPGTMRLHPITASTLAFLVCVGGWLLLLGVPLIAYFVMHANEQA